ncbi:MAG TPA: beta-eliminating lyase-related protein [Gaiellaceae bacterium]|nr:beta-eliminating lyase-related protein [Gaiellaceae bacterium]
MIDLRSDICTGPTDEMSEAMRSARIEPAAFGPDETVERLEQRGAGLLGREEAAFVATWSLAKLIAVLALTRPGGRAASTPTSARTPFRLERRLALERDGHVRFVTHRLIGDDEIRRAGEMIASVATQASAVTTATRPAT